MDEALKLFNAFRPCLDVVASTVQDTARRWLPDLSTGEQVVIGDRQLRLLRLVRNLIWLATPPPPRAGPTFGSASCLHRSAGAMRLRGMCRHQLGEGGYSFVYLAEESAIGDAGQRQQYAIKKVITFK